MREPVPALGVPLLFDYLYWLRDTVLAKVGELDGATFLETPRIHDRDLRATLVHELDVERSWRARLRGEPEAAWGEAALLIPERYPSIAVLAAQWRDDEAVMRGWLDRLTAADHAAPVTVNRLEGYPLSTYLLHVVAHGVTELSAAAGILHVLGHPAGDIGVLNALDDLAPLARPDATEGPGT